MTSQSARRMIVALVLFAALTFAAPPGAAAFHGNTGPIATQNCTTTNTIPRLTTASTTAAVLDCTPMTSDGTNVTLASGHHLGPDGTQALPTYSFTSEPSSGLWRIPSGTLGISVLNIDVIRFNTSSVITTTASVTLGSSGSRWSHVFVGTSGIDSTGNINLSNGLLVQVPTSGGVQTFQGAGNPTGFLRLSANVASSHTTGAAAGIGMDHSFTPASGSGSYALLHLNPTINGTSSGTAYGLVVASVTNVLTGGTIKLASFGTTTTDAFTGYTPVFDVSTTGVAIGTATPTTITNIRIYSQTITPASVAAAVCAEQTFTVTGLTTADKVEVNHAATGNGTGLGGWRVSAANTIAITYCNPTAGALTPGAGTYNIKAVRS